MTQLEGGVDGGTDGGTDAQRTDDDPLTATMEMSAISDDGDEDDSNYRHRDRHSGKNTTTMDDE